MAEIEKDIEKYFKKVKSSIFCDKTTKKELEAEIRSSLYDYAELKGIKDISEIYEKFGTPEELAKTYLAYADPKKIKRISNIRKFTILCVVIFITIFAIYLIDAFIDLYNDSYGYFEEEMLEPSYFTIYERGEA